MKVPKPIAKRQQRWAGFEVYLPKNRRGLKVYQLYKCYKDAALSFGFAIGHVKILRTSFLSNFYVNLTSY